MHFWVSPYVPVVSLLMITLNGLSDLSLRSIISVNMPKILACTIISRCRELSRLSIDAVAVLLMALVIRTQASLFTLFSLIFV